MLERACAVVTSLDRGEAITNYRCGGCLQFGILQRFLELGFDVVLAAFGLLDDRLVDLAGKRLLEIHETTMRCGEQAGVIFGGSTEPADLGLQRTRYLAAITREVSEHGRELGAIVAAFLGWFAGGFYLTDRNPILMTHRWLGTAIAGVGLVLVYLAAGHRRAPERSRKLYLVLLGLMTLAISVQGFRGGTFMHGGLNHLAF